MSDKLGQDVEENVFSSRSENYFFNTKICFQSSLYFRDATDAAKELFPRRLYKEVIYSSDTSQNFSYLIDLRSGRNAYPDVERFVMC